MSATQEPAYVTHEAWLDPSGRADAIDEIADGFERHFEPGVAASWSPVSGRAWPMATKDRRSTERLHPAEHRASWSGYACIVTDRVRLTNVSGHARGIGFRER